MDIYRKVTSKIFLTDLVKEISFHSRLQCLLKVSYNLEHEMKKVTDERYFTEADCVSDCRLLI